jgi:hypothetical protein
MLLSAVEAARDWVVLAAGIVWGLVTFGVMAVFAALWWLTRKYFGKANQLIEKKVRPMLERVHTQAAVIQDRTSRLPGNVPTPEAESRAVVRSRSRPRLPWPRRKRRRLPIIG